MKRRGSMTYEKSKLLSRNTVRITSNISLLVKKYAAFLFEEEGLNIDNDKMNCFLSAMIPSTGFEVE